jgi:hypothetical protein
MPEKTDQATYLSAGIGMSSWANRVANQSARLGTVAAAAITSSRNRAVRVRGIADHEVSTLQHPLGDPRGSSASSDVATVAVTPGWSGAVVSSR